MTVRELIIELLKEDLDDTVVIRVEDGKCELDGIEKRKNLDGRVELSPEYFLIAQP